MRTVILVAFVLIAAFVVCKLVGNKSENVSTDKQQPIAVSQYSDKFNKSVDEVMSAYYYVTEDLVEWDSVEINSKSVVLKTKLDSLNLQELDDSSGIRETASTFVDHAKNDVALLEKSVDLEKKRHALNSLTENLYNFLRVVRYDREKLYLQECPMAFNDEEPGIWLSKNPEIRNPYLGLHHPRYGKGMLSCGETKETLNFTGPKK